MATFIKGLSGGIYKAVSEGDGKIRVLRQNPSTGLWEYTRLKQIKVLHVSLTDGARTWKNLGRYVAPSDPPADATATQIGLPGGSSNVTVESSTTSLLPAEATGYEHRFFRNSLHIETIQSVNRIVEATGTPYFMGDTAYVTIAFFGPAGFGPVATSAEITIT